MTAFIAQRGISVVAPENTLASFTLVWAYDCDGIKLEVQANKDGKVVVCHGADAERIQHCTIAGSNETEISKINVRSAHDCRYQAERMPLLTDVLMCVPTGKIVQIEIKAQDVTSIVEILRQARRDIVIWVMSFSLTQLATVIAALPRIATIWLIKEQPIDWAQVIQKATAQCVTGLGITSSLLDRYLIEQIHAAGLIVDAWTVNTRDEAMQLQNCQVAMITSDCPHMFYDIWV